VAEYQLEELAELAGVTARTIRYYIQQGLVPSPGSGAGVRYTDTHLLRLRAIKQLQRSHLPLNVIRQQLEALDEVALQDLVSPKSPEGSALDYVRRALSRDSIVVAQDERPAAGKDAVAASIPGATPTVARSQWDRITLAPAIELHVRRPLDRESNRRIERLIELARRIFEEPL